MHREGLRSAARVPEIPFPVVGLGSGIHNTALVSEILYKPSAWQPPSLNKASFLAVRP